MPDSKQMRKTLFFSPQMNEIVEFIARRCWEAKKKKRLWNHIGETNGF